MLSVQKWPSAAVLHEGAAVSYPLRGAAAPPVAGCTLGLSVAGCALGSAVAGEP